VNLLLAVVLVAFLAYLVHRFLGSHACTPAPPQVAVFLDSRLRRAVQPPQRIVERSKIGKGMCVLEVGCGNGVVAACAARAVGGDGKVYGLDIQPAMLDLFKRKLQEPENADIRNVQLVAADACALPFPPQSFDVVYTVEALGEVPDQHKALVEMRRVLKPDGILAVTEFFIDPHYARRSTTLRKCTAADFLPEATAGTFWNYTLTFRKA